MLVFFVNKKPTDADALFRGEEIKHVFHGLCKQYFNFQAETENKENTSFLSF
ncbi:MAG: hypothetical protein BWY65_00394 [Firmicutes bacterium ADurb.Bin373]|nr:MAG: hypothetical protein BWY65_00394 [Firmicutes bacterium ADurb.Bin373]